MSVKNNSVEISPVADVDVSSSSNLSATNDYSTFEKACDSLVYAKTGKNTRNNAVLGSKTLVPVENPKQSDLFSVPVKVTYAGKSIPLRDSGMPVQEMDVPVAQKVEGLQQAYYDSMEKNETIKIENLKLSPNSKVDITKEYNLEVEFVDKKFGHQFMFDYLKAFGSKFSGKAGILSDIISLYNNKNWIVERDLLDVLKKDGVNWNKTRLRENFKTERSMFSQFTNEFIMLVLNRYFKNGAKTDDELSEAFKKIFMLNGRIYDYAGHTLLIQNILSKFNRNLLKSTPTLMDGVYINGWDGGNKYENVYDTGLNFVPTRVFPAKLGNSTWNALRHQSGLWNYPLIAVDIKDGMISALPSTGPMTGTVESYIRANICAEFTDWEAQNSDPYEHKKIENVFTKTDRGKDVNQKIDVGGFSDSGMIGFLKGGMWTFNPHGKTMDTDNAIGKAVCHEGGPKGRTIDTYVLEFVDIDGKKNTVSLYDSNKLGFDASYQIAERNEGCVGSRTKSLVWTAYESDYDSWNDNLRYDSVSEPTKNDGIPSAYPGYPTISAERKPGKRNKRQHPTTTLVVTDKQKAITELGRKFWHPKLNLLAKPGSDKSYVRDVRTLDAYIKYGNDYTNVPNYNYWSQNPVDASKSIISAVYYKLNRIVAMFDRRMAYVYEHCLTNYCKPLALLLESDILEAFKSAPLLLLPYRLGRTTDSSSYIGYVTSKHLQQPGTFINMECPLGPPLIHVDKPVVVDKNYYLSKGLTAPTTTETYMTGPKNVYTLVTGMEIGTKPETSLDGIYSELFTSFGKIKSSESILPGIFISDSGVVTEYINKNSGNLTVIPLDANNIQGTVEKASESGSVLVFDISEVYKSSPYSDNKVFNDALAKAGKAHSTGEAIKTPFIVVQRESGKIKMTYKVSSVKVNVYRKSTASGINNINETKVKGSLENSHSVYVIDKSFISSYRSVMLPGCLKTNPVES